MKLTAVKRIIVVSIFIKLLLLIFFSSDYQNHLFIPFVKHFVNNFDNPWSYFYNTHSSVEFPYNPLMLYILSFFYMFIKFFGITNQLAVNFFFKLPLLLSDLIILKIFFEIFPREKRKIVFLYFLSPIILYSTYMHSQLDIIPTALLFLSVYLLRKNKIYLSSLFFGLALSTKSHIIVAFFFILVYILKKYSLREMIFYALISLSVFLLFILPYIFSDGYYLMVLSNPKQQMIYDLYFNVKNYKVYLPILFVLLMYLRFFSYKKVNFELLESYLAFSFSVFILLILPAPAWYLWMLPYMIIFHLKNYEYDKRIIYFFHILSFFYLIFYIFFYIPEYTDLIFITKPISYKVNSIFYRNIAYTFLLSTLLGNIYLCYKHGIRRNRIYNKFKALILGISGDSGSGKTLLSNDISMILQSSVVKIEGDADHRWERDDKNWKNITHLDPKANYLYKQYQDLLELKKGNAIFRREYDHKKGVFTKERIVEPKDFIILTGLHTFYLPLMRNIIDLKIFLNPQEELRKEWKIKREIKKRGYTKDEVLKQLSKREKDSQIFIKPQKKYADIIISYSYQTNRTDKLALKITLSTKFNLENFVLLLSKEGIEYDWRFLENFDFQELELMIPPSKDKIVSVASRLFMDINNIIDIKFNWLDGYRGFVQLLIVYIQLYGIIQEIREL